MNVKLFEIRDRGTFVVAFAFRPVPTPGNEVEDYLLRRAGWGDSSPPSVYLGKCDGSECHYDPYDWRSSTMQEAHFHIAREFESLKSGEVIDAEFLRGESTEPKLSEAVG